MRLQYPVLFDVRTKARSIATNTGTKDLQMINIHLRVLSRPDEAFLPKIYRELGTDYEFRVLPSIANEVLKAVVVRVRRCPPARRRRHSLRGACRHSTMRTSC